VNLISHMNENELKNYLAAQEIITDNVLDKHVYKIAKNEEGDITSDDLELIMINLKFLLILHLKNIF